MAILTKIDLRMYAKILAILTKYGLDAKYSVTGPTSYNPTTGTVERGDPIPYNLKVTPPAPAEEMFDRDVLSTEVTDKTMIMVAARGLDFVPSQGDKVEIEGVNWVVQPPIKTWYSGQLKALYGLVIER